VKHGGAELVVAGAAGRRANRIVKSRFFVATVIAVALQVPLFWAFGAATDGSGVAYTCEDLVGPRRAEMSARKLDVLGARCAPKEKRILARLAPEKPPELPENAQVVEVPDQAEAVDPKPVETKLVADKTTRTEKETRSEVTKRSETKGSGRESVKEKSPVQSQQATSEKPTVTTAEQKEEVKLADVRERFPEADKGQKKPESVMDRGRDTQLLLPSTSAKNAIANMQALSGDFTSNDHLPDMERAKSTVLNANAYKFADFFNGVKRAVERHWRPSEVYLRRDPSGQLFGVKDRYTVLRVDLDKAGKIISVISSRPSGLDFMDEEAKRAFQAAGPFPNPPAGLQNAEGIIRFEFGFYFEITAGKYRFNWRRL
jgi:TonB family protein